MTSLSRVSPLLLIGLLSACGSSASADTGASSGGGAGLAGAGGDAASAGVGGAVSGGAGGAGGAGTGGLGAGGLGAEGGTGGLEACAAIPTCGAPPPDPGPKRDWRHSITSPLVVNTGFANLRGRDLFLTEADDQWVIGKVAYGVTDKDLKDEEVDIWLLRDCAGTQADDWEFLGTAITTQDNMHATVEGVDDSGGRVYFQIPTDKRLGPGRHRLRLVVAGDHSTADLYIEVLPSGQKVFATDVDGTLTTKENEEFTALLTGTLPNVNSGAPEALRAIAQRGYRPFYLTARPEFLVGRTREFLEVYGFPPGIVHTTTTLTGATGNAAVDYKLAELDATYAKGFPVFYAFGNTASDAEAFASAGVADGQRLTYQFTDSSFGCTRFDDYSALVPTLSALPLACLYW
ncbi:MAG: phosphatidylinositol transfer protein [Myxococcales bacterium]|nr:phosphatidylinositol transfer protein [Myxococcales bacterium]